MPIVNRFIDYKSSLKSNYYSLANREKGSNNRV